jgi:hypothetical protein
MKYAALSRAGKRLTKSGTTASGFVVVIAAATVAALSQPAWAARTTQAAPPGAHSVHFHLVTAATHVKFVGEHRLPGGDYAASWRLFGERVKVAGPSGSTVIVPRPATKHAFATIRPPAPAHKASLFKLAAAYARSGKSVVQDAMAVGYTRTQALKLARQVAGSRAGQLRRYKPR